MNKYFKISLWLASAIVFLACCISYALSIFPHKEAQNIPERPRFIAHGGGGIPGVGRISNSLEALAHSHEKGYQLIEVDFHWVSDNQLVLIHDWEWAYEKWFGHHNKIIPTLKEFLSLDMKSGLTQMQFNDLLVWMQENGGVSIVTDVKKDNIKALRLIFESAGELSKRFIPQAYSRAEYDEIKALGFDHVILTLYRTKAWNFQLNWFAEKHPDIFAMTMRPERAKQGDLGAELKRRGIFVYAHTINDSKEFTKLQKYGISGIYTDYLIGDE